MDQQVDILVKLTLSLDTTLSRCGIVARVRKALPKAFGEDLTQIDVIDVKEEAAIYAPPRAVNLYSATLDDLCDVWEKFRTRHRLPEMSADELLYELYSEEPRREDLCAQVSKFIDLWEVVSDTAVSESRRQEGGTG